jgi:hypothetical protein
MRPSPVTPTLPAGFLNILGIFGLLALARLVALRRRVVHSTRAPGLRQRGILWIETRFLATALALGKAVYELIARVIFAIHVSRSGPVVVHWVLRGGKTKSPRHGTRVPLA